MTEKPKKWPGQNMQPLILGFPDGLRVVQPGTSIKGPPRSTKVRAIRAWNRAVEKAREGK